MRFLFCCESYYPDRGGVQEVMQQLAERMAKAGHDVTVATSRNLDRKFETLNGVTIREFNVAGKLAYAITGDVDRYREFVVEFAADAILIMAAQQWSFDSLWTVLDQIESRKVFIPCGFSCLYEPHFAEYFRQLPAVLRKFDHLIFNAEHYRDIDFVRALGMENFSVLPNGVSELEFDTKPVPSFRNRLGISNNDFVFLTVGNPVNMKGHREVAEAFARLDTMGRPTTLILIARWPQAEPEQPKLEPKQDDMKRSSPLSRALLILRQRGLREFMKRVLQRILVISGAYVIWQRIKRAAYLAGRSVEVVRAEGWDRFRTSLMSALGRRREPIAYWVDCANLQPGKRVLCQDLTRSDLVQAYMAADLFVFASIVEYSPLVLFETGAAGTPFLSVPVGNAEEIARWTGGGIICPAAKDDRGYTRVDPKVLAREMQKCMCDPDMLFRLGAIAKQRWQQQFTWTAVAARYESILSGCTSDVVPDRSERPRHIGAQAR